MIGREDKALGTLFNKTDGGDGGVGRIASEEERRKRRERYSAMSEEEKKARATKISLSYKTKTPEERDAIRQTKVMVHRAIAASSTDEQKRKRSENSSNWQKNLSAEEKDLLRKKQSAAKNSVCTLDYKTFYSSRRAMAAALGAGKNGTRSPNFRYIKDDKN
jgi:hypothetical protein